MIFSSAAPTVIQFLQSILLGVLLSFIYDIFCSIRELFPAQVQQQLQFILDILYFLLFGTMLFNFLLQESAGRLRYFIVIGVAIGWVVYHNTVSALTIQLLNGIFILLRRVLFILLQPILAIIKLIRRVLSAVHDKYSTKRKFSKISLKKSLGPLYNKVSKEKTKESLDEKNCKLQSKKPCSNTCDCAPRSAHRRFFCKRQGRGGPDASCSK